MIPAVDTPKSSADIPLTAIARILLADDSVFERAALAMYLTSIGYAVSEAGNGREAIEHIKSHEVDALLLDLHMPESDGFEVLTYLQVHRRSLPVIVLSGMPVDQIQKEIHSLPNHELPPLMFKPIDIEQLVQLLEMQLSGAMPVMEESNESAPAGKPTPAGESTSAGKSTKGSSLPTEQSA